jgi:hypothetical protein
VSVRKSDERRHVGSLRGSSRRVAWDRAVVDDAASGGDGPQHERLFARLSHAAGALERDGHPGDAVTGRNPVTMIIPSRSTDTRPADAVEPPPRTNHAW